MLVDINNFSTVNLQRVFSLQVISNWWVLIKLSTSSADDANQGNESVQIKSYFIFF